MIKINTHREGGTAVKLPPTRLFGTDGIRGKAEELFQDSFNLEIGFWTGKILQSQLGSWGPILLGRDSRNSSPRLAGAIATGLIASGLEVWDLGLCPTPCVAYLIAQTGAIGGIMISASHNPPMDNGVKFFGTKGKKLDPQTSAEIEAALRSNHNLHHASILKLGSRSQPQLRPELVNNYQAELKQSLPNNLGFRGLKIVLDLAWGAAVTIAPKVFKELGADVITLHNLPNGDRINVNCGSTHLEPLQAAVIHHQADLGFAFDGDADRVIAVDGQGRMVNGDHILYLWGKKLQADNYLPRQQIVSTVMANLGFEKAWHQLGGALLRTPVGDQYVQAKMEQTGAILGGEPSGHILCHHYSLSGDGLQTALHLTNLVSQSGTSLQELVRNSFEPYPQFLQSLRVKNTNLLAEWQDCQPLQEAIHQAQQAIAPNGRVLVRASGTEPVLRVMVEAEQRESAVYWLEYLLKTVDKHLELI